MAGTAPRYYLTTLGGFKLGSDANLYRLAEKARPTLEAGWPVFVRSNEDRSNSLELQWHESGAMTSTPAGSPKPWMKTVEALFSPSR